MENISDSGSGQKRHRSGKNTILQTSIFSALALMLVFATVSFSFPAAYAANTITVQGKSLDGKALNMWITIQQNGSTVKTGFTPLTFSGVTGSTYTVVAHDYDAGSIFFDHWGNGSTNKSRTVTLNSNVWLDAFYKTGSSGTTTSGSTVTSGSGISSLIPKTGVYVALYMYPSSTGSVHWQKVIDEKTKHPSVPIVVTFNPNSGPGSSKDNTIATWVGKLKAAGVIAIGYTYDDYGTRSLTALKADADKYKNWYNADGLFIDEFTNKVGYETHYGDLTAYVKSIGMKMTMGNPGTDVPPSYVGKVDVINTTEGRGYISMTDPNLIGSNWVSGGYTGWHKDYDKRSFVVIRYDISSLDTSFVSGASQYVGLMYITSGNDSNGRWFALPSYFSSLVAALDK